MPRLAALGGLALLDGQGLLVGSAGRGRNLALLAILSRSGEAGLGREKIAALLWPERDEEHARHSLDQAVYSLRRAFGADVVVTRAGSLTLNPAVVTSDVAAFERALEVGEEERAVELYAGPFLDGFHLDASPEFEQWVDLERARLQRAYLSALERLAKAAEDRDARADAIRYSRSLADAEPLSARLTLRLMRALEGAGDRTGALEVAMAHRARVREELDAPPEPAVAAYEKELRREPESRPSAATGASATSGQPPGPGGGAAAPQAARKGRRWRVALGLGLGTATLLVAGALLSPQGGRGPPGALPRVAVLPFENETGDPAFRALGRMAADWITEGLVRTDLVQVVEPARAGEAESVVAGRIYRTADSIWLRARVTRPRNGLVLSVLDPVGTRSTRPALALEPLRDGILGVLGTLYDQRISGWAGADAHPPSYAAYREFAEGIERVSLPRDLPGAAEHFRRASDLDPEYLLPRLWLTWTRIMAGDFERADSLAEALRSARPRMSRLENAWHNRIVALLAGDNEGSFRAALRMVEAAPGSGWAIALANAALDTNRPSVAISALLAAAPEGLGLESAYGQFLLAAAYHLVGNYDRELEVTEETVRAHGLGWGFVGPGIPGLAALGRIDELQRRLEELQDAPSLEGGRPAGPTALLTAVTELRTHGFTRQAEALFRRWSGEDGGRDRIGAWTDSAALPIRIDLLYEAGRWDAAAGLLSELPRRGDHDLFPEGMRGLLAARVGDTATARRIDRELARLDRESYRFGEPTFWRARLAAVLGRRAEAVSLLRQAFGEGQGAPAWYRVHAGRDFDVLKDREDFRQLIRPRP